MPEPLRVRTIADLARLAGVSPGTVSRALSGAGLISQRTRDRIQELARQHDFRPNIMARNLRIRRTGAIGVVASLGPVNGSGAGDPSRVTESLGQLADMLEERGYVLILSRRRGDDQRQVFAVAESGRVDAVVVMDEAAAAADGPAGVPVLAWDGADAAGVVGSLLARLSPPAAA